MGRRSTSGSRFLVRRTGTDLWTYHRNLPADIAPKVIVEVRLYWCGRVAKFRGKRAIAISLGTSDRREAERRRDQIHAEIETTSPALCRWCGKRELFPKRPGLFQA